MRLDYDIEWEMRRDYTTMTEIPRVTLTEKNSRFNYKPRS